MRNRLFLILVLALLYFISGKLSLYFLSHEYFISIGLFPAEGIALAFVLYFGRAVIPGIFIGQFVLLYTNNVDLLPSLSISIVNSTEAYIAYVLLRKLHFNNTLMRFRDFGILFVTIIFVFTVFSAVVSNVSLLFLDVLSEKDFFINTISWWFGNMMGQVLFTPFLLLLFREFTKDKIFEYLVFGFIVGTIFYSLTIWYELTNPFLLFNMILPVIILVVAYRGIFYGAYLNVIVSVIAAYSVYLDIGAFTVNSELNNIVNYDLFILSLIGIVLSVGLLLDERKKTEEKLQEEVSIAIEKNSKQELMLLQQSRLAQMGEMISMIAHQWRQPLNNLALVNQLLVSKYNKNSLDDKTLEYFKTNSKKQIDLMSKTIDDFRNYFKQDEMPSTFFVNDMLDDVLDMLTPLYGAMGIKLEFTYEGRYQTVGYKNELSHAVINILNNAKDALLETQKDDKKVAMMLKEEEDLVVIEIVDNAGGIPTDIIDDIFNPYFSTKMQKNGTGLGLYMAKMIVQEKMQGSLEVKNTRDGAEFKIYLERDKNES